MIKVNETHVRAVYEKTKVLCYFRQRPLYVRNALDE